MNNDCTRRNKSTAADFVECFAEVAVATSRDYCNPMMTFLRWALLLAAVIGWSASALRADQVVMQNGDVLNGKVLSVTSNSLVLQNENLGQVTLARPKVTAIHFGAGSVANPLPAPSANSPLHAMVPPPTNSATDWSAAFRGIRSQSNLVQQVQSRVLSTAGPDAVNKFNELLDGLSSGQIDMNDLRRQAQSAADQLRELKKELGPDTGIDADSYLSILDNFLRETAPGNAVPNSSGVSQPAKPSP